MAYLEVHDYNDDSHFTRKWNLSLSIFSKPVQGALVNCLNRIKPDGLNRWKKKKIFT